MAIGNSVPEWPAVDAAAPSAPKDDALVSLFWLALVVEWSTALLLTPGGLAGWGQTGMRWAIAGATICFVVAAAVLTTLQRWFPHLSHNELLSVDLRDVRKERVRDTARLPVDRLQVLLNAIIWITFLSAVMLDPPGASWRFLQTMVLSALLIWTRRPSPEADSVD